jgi:hypothetical protein
VDWVSHELAENQGPRAAKRRDALPPRSTGEKPAADNAGAHCQASLIVYTTPAHVQAPVAAAGQITTAGDDRQLQQSLKVVF